jgi:hypothetical protein
MRHHLPAACQPLTEQTNYHTILGPCGPRPSVTQTGARPSVTQADAFIWPSVLCGLAPPYPQSYRLGHIHSHIDWATYPQSHRLGHIHSHTGWAGYKPFDAHSLGMPLYLTWGNYSQATLIHSLIFLFHIIIHIHYHMHIHIHICITLFFTHAIFIHPFSSHSYTIHIPEYFN